MTRKSAEQVAAEHVPEDNARDEQIPGRAATSKTILEKLRNAITRVKYHSELRFALAFGCNAAVLFSVYSFPYPDGSWARRWSDSYLNAYAQLSGRVLSVFERNVAVSGQEIIGHYSLRIVRGCDAIDAQILLISAVFASSAYSLRSRVLGALLGFLLITAVNVVRICSLYYVGSHFPSSFDFFHHEVWPLFLIVLAGAGFVLWSRLAISSRSPSHAVA